MATNQTENYKLNQWELSDSVVMEEFNADNQKLDAALAALDQKIADAAEQVKASIPHVQTGTYVGTGTYGPNAPNTLTFSFTPKLFIISQNDITNPNSSTGNGEDTRFIAVYGTPRCYSHYGAGPTDTAADMRLTWGPNSLSWYSDSAQYQGNVSGVTYHYIAIG